MSRKARFTTFSALDSATKQVTVTIDRDTELVAVRPHRSRRVYELPLAWVAKVIYRKVVMTEVAEQKAAKKAAKKNRIVKRRR